MTYTENCTRAYLVKRVPSHVAASQRLIVTEDNRVVLSIGLVTALFQPLLVGRQLGWKSSYVPTVHVEVRLTVDYPLGQLFSAATYNEK